MQKEKLNIVTLIDTNPLVKLTNNYNNKLLEKIQNSFINNEQQMFLASFYCYLNYNSKNDFVISLNDIWKWIGFGRQDDAKKSLKKHFTIDVDYIVYKIEKAAPEVAGAALLPENEVKAAPPAGGAALVLEKAVKNTKTKNLGGAGLNKEKVLMTINTFKKFCLKAGTKKADEIHDYYIKLEEILYETLKEEALELRNQLEVKDKEKQQVILDSYHKKCVVYLIKISEKLYKFGNTDNIKRRFQEHRREIGVDIELIYCIESKNNVKLENDFKKYLQTTDFKKDQVINGKNQTELIEINELGIDSIKNQLNDLNKVITEDKEYLQIEILKLEIEKLKEERIKERQQQQVEQDNLDEDEKLLNEENDIIDNLPENTKQELEEKKRKLEEMRIKRNEYHKQWQAKYRKTEKYKELVQSDEYKKNSRKRMQKYRSSDLYKKYLQSDKFKESEKTRYIRRSETEYFKNYKKEYYKNNKEKLDKAKEILRKKKCKTTLLNTEAEKIKFKNWLELNIIEKNKGKLIWRDLLEKYLGYHTSALISKIYKNYFIEYTTEKFPNIKTKYLQFKLETSHWGYRNFELIN